MDFLFFHSGSIATFAGSEVRSKVAGEKGAEKFLCVDQPCEH